MTTSISQTKKSLKFLEKLSGEKLTISNLLWSIREADEIRQVDFAHTLGISRQYLCDLEHNRKGLSPERAARFARILGYSEEQFIRLAIQDALDRAGLHFKIDIQKAAYA
jgi:transcriptional regulator with XRE-family HTH domain